jgi:hypothetical protein
MLTIENTTNSDFSNQTIIHDFQIITNDSQINTTKNNDNLSFNIGLSVGIGVGIMIGVVLFLILRQKSTNN